MSSICTFVLITCIPNVETSGLKSLERWRPLTHLIYKIRHYAFNFNNVYVVNLQLYSTYSKVRIE